MIGYKLFAHIKVMMEYSGDPFATYSDGGYQVAQSHCSLSEQEAGLKWDFAREVRI